MAKRKIDLDSARGRRCLAIEGLLNAFEADSFRVRGIAAHHGITERQALAVVLTEGVLAVLRMDGSERITGNPSWTGRPEVTP